MSARNRLNAATIVASVSAIAAAAAAADDSKVAALNVRRATLNA